jgi:acyl-CoA thioester hydrolase
VGGKSLTLEHRIESATREGLRYADGQAVMVWVDRSGASIPLPAAVRTACA